VKYESKKTHFVQNARLISLRRMQLKNIRTGVQKNTLSFNAKYEWFDFQEYEFESDGIFEEFNCSHCGTEVSKAIENYI
jgi:hypothetical protein